MFEIICKDEYGNLIQNLTQWDVNQTLYISEWPYTNVPTFHFCNRRSEEALVVNGTVADSGISVQVPNILLQEPYPIITYVYLYGNNGEAKTIYTLEIPVRQRIKPSDYIYIDDTPYITVVQLDARLTSLINELSDDIPGTYNLEVIDARVGYDGTIHDTLGESVRALGEEIESVAANAVDGLYYSENMLYLTSNGEIASEPVEIVSGGGGGGGGTTDHRSLTNRSASDQHPISAITGLTAALNGKADASDIPSPYVLPVGGTNLGGVKNGGNVTINADGTMTASGGGSGGTTDHTQLTNRDVSNQHPISAITDLQDELDGKAAASHNHAASDIDSGTLDSARLPTVPVSKGGSGKTSWTANRIPYPSAGTTFAQLAFPSATGSFLRQNTSGAPYWSTPAEVAAEIGGGGGSGGVTQETGTWTPEVCGTDSGTSTAPAQVVSASYIKTGSLLFFTAAIMVTSFSAISGNVFVSGLPYVTSVGGLANCDVRPPSGAGYISTGLISSNTITLHVWDDINGFVPMTSAIYTAMMITLTGVAKI